ncbi:MAG: hypothetical protein IK123_08065 [Lachnospiraceae bacterium]|nr:hypothetical protein [Lachnospiraceae bacterium]
MDLFIDKLAQKIVSKESVTKDRATTSESKEIMELREKVENYEKLLQEMKLVNLKNIESADRLNVMADDLATAYQEMKNMNALNAQKEADAAKAAEAAESERDVLKEFFDKQDDTIHKENIKVYRNVQAAMTEGLTEQTKSILDAQQAASKKSGTGFIKVMSVLIFLAVLADIALKVLPMFWIQF